MSATGFMSVAAAAELIVQGHWLSIAGDENALRSLPQGNWIGGTIPYFMASEGGVIDRERVFVTAVPLCEGMPVLRRYDVDRLPALCRNAPENGYTLLIVPAFSPTHAAFAENAPNYEEMYMKPLIGWVAGVHLDELGERTPKVVFGPTGEFSDQDAVALEVALPPGRFAHVDIVNPFAPGSGPVFTFPEGGFKADACLIDGQPARLGEYLQRTGADLRLPLVADYCGALINVSLRAIADDGGQVEFYAPVFPGVAYRQAAPLADYRQAFAGALPGNQAGLTFSCNCILNFLYMELEGVRTGQIQGPITFGEIAYQLLNQTLVYLRIDE